MPKQVINLKLGQVCIGVRNPQCRYLPYNPNYFLGRHWSVKHKWADAWIEEVWAAWLRAKNAQKGLSLPFKRAELIIHCFCVKTQDMDNFYGSLKPIIDGLKQVGIIEDDTFEKLKLKEPVFVKVGKLDNQHLELSIINKNGK